jgi:RNA polymerase sigma-70 factor (ECF subfamily)
MAVGPEYGLAIIDRPELQAELKDYRWMHSTWAGPLRRMNRFRESAEAYPRALALAENAAERPLLARRLADVHRSVPAGSGESG